VRLSLSGMLAASRGGSTFGSRRFIAMLIIFEIFDSQYIVGTLEIKLLTNSSAE